MTLCIQFHSSLIIIFDHAKKVIFLNPNHRESTGDKSNNGTIVTSLIFFKL